MYLLSSGTTAEGINALRENVKRTGTATKDDDWSRCASAQVWASSINDPGEDFCELRMFDADARQFATYRMEGY